MKKNLSPQNEAAQSLLSAIVFSLLLSINFSLSTIVFPSANKHIAITRHDKIKQTSHHPPDATPFLCSFHSNTHSKSCLYFPSTLSLLLVFLGLPLIWISSPTFYREVTHDLHIANFNGAFSILIICNRQHLTVNC